MILQYKSSNGNLFDLKVGNIRTRTANFHDFEWIPRGHEQRFGEKVYRFDKDPVVYSATMSVFGSLDRRKEVLNLLHGSFEADIHNMKPGRITHGAFYIDCYITFSSTGYENPFTNNTINIYCPYPFWIRDNRYRFEVVQDDTPYEYLDYPYDYNYDFSRVLIGHGVANNPGSGGADFTLTIYENTTQPFIKIDGVRIGAMVSVGEGERLVIDTKTKTVYKYGTEAVNCFNSRYKDVSIFEKLAPGDHEIIWSGKFAFDLDIHEERSEPFWI